MNIQAMVKQLQKDMLKAKEEIDNTTFTGKSSFVTIEMNGTKKILSVKIDMETIEKEEIELLEDMVLVAINDVMTQIDNVTEEKMGRFTQGMPGLF